MSENLVNATQPDTILDSADVVSKTNEATASLSIEDILKLPEVKNLLESARTQEKNKLYKSIEAKEAEVKQLQENLSQVQSQLTSKENESLTEMELLQKTIKELKSQHEALVSSIQSEREAEKIKRREAELNAYKERRLREEGNELVIALVGGTSEQLIEDSIVFAKEQYAEIVSRALEKTKAENQTPKIAPSKVTNPSGTSGVPIRRADIRNMSAADWAKNRDRIRELASTGQIME